MASSSIVPLSSETSRIHRDDISVPYIDSIHYRSVTGSVNSASCITRNVLEIRSAPHLGMSSKPSPSARIGSGGHEGCGGAFDGGPQGGDQADGEAVIL